MNQPETPPEKNHAVSATETIQANNAAFYQTQATDPYIVIYTLNPVDQVPLWISYIESWFEPAGISLVYRHPEQDEPVDFFVKSVGVLLWNGTLPIFTPLKQWFSANAIKYSFVECGFFPQTQHVYFDREGINVECSLAHDDLTWLPNNAESVLSNKKAAFFKDVSTYNKHSNYTFVPLQLSHDSNIQLNSRFGKGMQSFIDYIEALYPNEVLVFKAHPRDTESYETKSPTSFWSTACSKSLIKSAQKVHGINSTVLFEAELYGVETIIEGDCLLSRHASRKREILTAIILYQFDIHGKPPSLEMLAERSYLRFDNL